MIKKLYKFLNPKFQTLFLEYKVSLKPRYGHGLPPHPELYAIVNERRKSYSGLLENALTHTENLLKINDHSIETDSLLPTWNNNFLPGLDIIGIYTMIAEFKPQQFIEIGSGTSTKVAYKAIKEQHLKTNIVSIDPQPRASVDNIVDEVIRMPFEDVGLNIVERLNENDILFIDNSHRILPNSDSMVFFLEVLPKLKKGVIVHIHDVYLPYDYPQFMCDRFYSEQYGLAMFLLANPKKYEPVLANYFISEDAELSKILLPFWDKLDLKTVERHGGSFWMRVN